MKKRLIACFTVLFAGSMLGGCGSMHSPGVSVVGGGVVGGVAGSAITPRSAVGPAPPLGTVGGALVGTQFGRQLDYENQYYAGYYY